MEHLDFYRQTTLPHFRKEEVAPVQVPKAIGPYKVETLLHKGSMSLLFLGVQPKDKQLVAIKVLSPELISHPNLVSQFLEEAKIISQVDHPNIVKLYGQGEWEHGLYIAMEFIQGISLASFIVGQSLSQKRGVDLILQVAYALLHLHTHGVIHRDLKPENILITENGKVKVIDFGIAQLLDETKILPLGPGGLIGTPSYMSPEQKRDPLRVSYNTDIYALGVIFYEILVGHLSFGNIQLDLLTPLLRPIVAKALAKNASARYQDVVDFITDLSNYIKSNAISKDLSGKEELKGIWEDLEEQHKNLLPKALPNWPEVEIGLGKSKGVYLFGTYYDFFRFPDGSMAIVLAESPISSAQSITSIATLRGVIRTLMHTYLFPEKDESFNSARFAFELNQIFYREPHDQEEAITILHLHPLLSEFAFISSGFEALWHLSYRGGAPKRLTNFSPFLGRDPNVEFYATKDTWNPGDIIVLHSFASGALSEQERQSIDQTTLHHISEHKTFAPSALAESLLLTLKDLSKDPSTLTQKLVLVFSRTG